MSRFSSSALISATRRYVLFDPLLVPVFPPEVGGDPLEVFGPGLSIEGVDAVGRGDLGQSFDHVGLVSQAVEDEVGIGRCDLLVGELRVVGEGGHPFQLLLRKEPGKGGVSRVPSNRLVLGQRDPEVDENVDIGCVHAQRRLGFGRQLNRSEVAFDRHGFTRRVVRSRLRGAGAQCQDGGYGGRQDLEVTAACGFHQIPFG